MSFCSQCGTKLNPGDERCSVCTPVASPSKARASERGQPIKLQDFYDSAGILERFPVTIQDRRAVTASPVSASTGFSSPFSMESPTAELRNPSRNPPPQTVTRSSSPSAASQQPAPGFWAAIRNPELRRRILQAATWALAKSLGLTALVLIPGFILLNFSPVIGIAWMFCGSFLLMARSYAKPWRLMWITCLLPAITSGVCLLLQLAVFSDRIPPISLLLPSVCVGLVIGVLRARSHSLYREQGAVMAQRTSVYLAIWAVCFGFAQFVGLYASTMPLIKGSLLASAFSTSMLICVSLVILSRYTQMKSLPHEVERVK